MPQNLADVTGIVTTFVPLVWKPNQNFLHSEWMCQIWAGATCVDYHHSSCNNRHSRNWQFKGFRGCLESALEPVQEKTSNYNIADTIWESPD
jgi:hypothetical protein